MLAADCDTGTDAEIAFPAALSGSQVTTGLCRRIFTFETLSGGGYGNLFMSPYFGDECCQRGVSSLPYLLYCALVVARPRILMFLSAGLITGLFSGRVLRAEQVPETGSLASLTAVVFELRAALEIPHQVEVVLVERNALVVSVSRHPKNASHFVISCEKGFLYLLTVDEIRAAMAHELGHVWIFTHHPYLQTEDLANSIAGRVVSSADLKQVHSKSQSYLTERKPRR